MARRLICRNRPRSNASGKGHLKRFWKDERGLWSYALCFFVLTLAIPFLFFVEDIETARYVKEATLAAADAASVAGAMQIKQKPISTGSYGQVTQYQNIADQPRSTEHASITLLKNLSHLIENNVDLVGYTVTFPTEDEVRVDVTVHYNAVHLTKAVQYFYTPSNGAIGVDLHVHSTSAVGQPQN